jgi:hypothetical protein
MAYQDFKNEWNGRRIDYDNVYGYQCVDLILQFLKECAGVPTGVWGNAIDYANRPTQAFLNAVVRVTDGSKQPGDILVFSGLAGNPYGHIALRDTDVTKMLEQNGATGQGTGTGRDAVGVYRAIPENRLVAVYRLKAFVSITPAPVSNKATVHLPADVQSWRLYRVGSGLRPNTSDQIAVLAPHQFGGLTYKVEAWIGDYAVVITTQMFGRGVIWVKGTEAQFN